MKIAITADIHLTIKSDHPERYNALENILNRIKQDGIENLIIAGDLFDKGYNNPKDFEALCRLFPGINLHIIPGNHDIAVSNKSIVGSNILIYTATTVVEIGQTSFLFIPYEEKTKMCDRINIQDDSVRKGWILVGHGDYYGGIKELNPLEPGTYMPLSKSTVSKFTPRAVFLGHIHKPTNISNVYYTGSPCGLDISETGTRRFLVYNTEDGSITSVPVVTDILYFMESFVIVPLENEIDILKQEITKRIKSWEIPESEFSKIIVRCEAMGYTMDRGAVMTALKEGFKDFKFYNDDGPLIESLSMSSDRQLSAIAERAVKLIDEFKWESGDDEPDKELIKMKALNVIYSG